LITPTIAQSNIIPQPHIEEAKREVLEGIMMRMAEIIECPMYGAVMTEDKANHGYYIVQWTSMPATHCRKKQISSRRANLCVMQHT
jgi:hypothetical protein